MFSSLHFPKFHIGPLWIFLAVLMVTGCQTAQPKPLILEVTPAAGEEVSAWGWVGVQFSQPVDSKSVENAFKLSPDISGEFIWEENTVWFHPFTAFDPQQTYTATLKGDLLAQNGQVFAVDKSWAVPVRQPSLIYYHPMGDLGEIWRLDLDGSDPYPLSKTNGAVVDFAASRSGNTIAYTVQNEAGGRDLWMVDRAGLNPRLLVECGQDGCGEPAWSMDMATIAYTREVYHPETGGYTPAQVWTVQVQSGETTQLYQSDVAYGHSPSFSPDGEKLASYDTTHDGIRILDLQSSQESVIPRVLPGSGDWSPDGSQIVFTDLVPAENEPFVVIYLVDLTTQEVTPALSEAASDTDFTQPRWSPDGNWLATSLRPVNAAVSKALWVLSLDGNQAYLIADEPAASFSAYRWDPWGDRLVYQRFEFNSSALSSSIWLWDWESGESRLLAQDAARPQWLP